MTFSMTGPVVFWFALGALAGLAHVRLLWRAAQMRIRSRFFPSRMLVVVGVLFAAALFKELLPAAAGWSVAFTAGVGLFLLRRPA
ncbi:MAG TPA: hypothetical protein VFY29_01040 [Terriglobia bacterium]|nr:hypothetical protein [Terriglobia bacterium]